MRLEVKPPWEWPASQKALMFLAPNRSNTRLVMFCRCASSTSVHMRSGVAVAAVGVAMTRRYFSLRSTAGK